MKYRRIGMLCGLLVVPCVTGVVVGLGEAYAVSRAWSMALGWHHDTLVFVFIAGCGCAGLAVAGHYLGKDIE